MEKITCTSPSSDLERYGRKLQRYLPAIQEITRVLQQLNQVESFDSPEMMSIQKQVLSQLRAAFNSEVAFIADEHGLVLLTDPLENSLLTQVLPKRQIERLASTEKSLVATADGDTYPELLALDIKSLLVTHMDISSQGNFLVGVCNVRDGPPAYLSEDKNFLRAVLDIVGFGLRYGRTRGEIKVSRDNYLRALASGDYSLLAQKSENFAQLLPPLVEEQNPIPRVVGIDAAIASQLDSKLCLLTMKSAEPTISGLWSEVQALWDRVRDPQWYPCTILAIARICAWAGYAKGERRLPVQLPSESLDLLGSPRDLAEFEAGDLFFTLPMQLIEKVSPPEQTQLETRPGLWQIDWLRSLWQRVHYLARCGTHLPEEPWVEQCKQLYQQVRPATVWVLRDYLVEAQIDRGLGVNSDWLSAWMITNVLLSRKLAKQYRLDPTIEYPKNVFNWTLFMLYLQHLSEAILYSLHCARHLELGRALKDVGHLEELQRFPFADVPFDSPHVSEAQLFVLSQYAQHEIGADDIDFYKSLTEQLQHELPLYVASSYYRDHLFHAVDVCLLGELLLRSAVHHPPATGSAQSLGGDFAEWTVKTPPPPLVDPRPGPPASGKAISLTGSPSDYQEAVGRLLELLGTDAPHHRDVLTYQARLAENQNNTNLYGDTEELRSERAKIVAQLNQVALDSLGKTLAEVGARPVIQPAYISLSNARQVLQNWYVAALCHDIGYVVEQADGLLKPVFGISAYGLKEFSSALEAGLKAGGDKVWDKVCSTLSQLPRPIATTDEVTAAKKVDGGVDHGVVAWLHLRSLMEEGKVAAAWTHALTAVLRHNLPEQEVNVRIEPLTLLLMLCDHLQEWGRPRVPPEELKCGVVEALRFDNAARFERRIPVRELETEGLLVIPPNSGLTGGLCDGCLKVPGCTESCPRVRTRIQDSGLVFKIKHAAQRQGDKEPVISWLEWCRDLQCLRLKREQIPYQISIALEHPPSQLSHLFSWKPPEMQLFQEYIDFSDNSKHLKEWVWAATEESGQSGLEHRLHKNEDKTMTETFIIHLHLLDHPLKKDLPENLQKAFSAWKEKRLREGNGAGGFQPA